MAISIVEKAVAAGATSLSCNIPAGTQNGDLLIAFFTAYAASKTMSVPNGWDTILWRDYTNEKMRVCTRTASSEPASYAWSTANTGANAVVCVVAVRGCSTTVHKSAEVGMSYTCPSVTTEVDNCLIFRYGWSSVDNRAHSFPGGTTEYWDHNYGAWTSSANQAGGYSTLTTAGATGTCVITPSSTYALGERGAVTVALSPAAPTFVPRTRVVVC